MATVGSLTIDIAANIARVQTDVNALRKNFKGLGDDLSKTASSMRTLETGLKAAISAAGAYMTFSFLAAKTREVIAAANEADAVEKRLATAFNSTGASARFTMEELTRLASEMQRTTIFSDDAVISAEALMLTFTKINRDTFPVAIRLAADLSTALGQDLLTSTRMIGKALSEPADALGALNRAGVVFSDEQKKQIEHFVKINELGKAQALILDELTMRFGGQSAAAAETFGGKLAQLKNYYNDIYEELGRVITRNQFFSSVLDIVNKMLRDTASWLRENRVAMMEWAKNGFMAFLTAIAYAIEAIRAFHNAWLGLQLIGHSVMLVFVEAVEGILIAFNAIGEAIEKLSGGRIKNPFASALESVTQYREAITETGAATIENIEKTNAGYDWMSKNLTDIINKLETVKTIEATAAPQAEGGGKQLDITPQFTDISLPWADMWKTLSSTAVKELTTIERHERMLEQSMKSVGNVHLKVTKALEDQYLTLMETGIFSMENLAKAVIKAIQQELAAYAAKMTMLGLVYAAKAIIALAEQDYAGAVRYGWASGEAFATAAAVTAVGYGLQSLMGGEESGGKTAAATSSGGAGTAGSMTLGTSAAEDGRKQEPPAHITINIHTLTGQIDGKAQEEIMRVINEAPNRNLYINANVVGGAA